jgi:flagellar biosynthesis protein FlhF
MLVLSVHTPVEDARSILESFESLGPTSLLFSKLDETRRYGAMVSIAAETGLPLSYFSVGQNVPDDIEMASPSKLAKLLLEQGGDRGGSGAQSS